ncbi:MAG: MoaD/ThiS family protein [Clostridia bacterium]|nr:MoaD/ThiS family protein [Clostridia bacterium]
MKTGKKILAVLLVFCFVLTAVPAFAADYAHTLTNKVYNDLWGRWDATASIQDLTVTVEIQSSGAPLTFEDATIQNMLKSDELTKAGCSITIPEYTLGEGENVYTMPARKAEIKTNYGLWITYLLPTNGEVATAMVEESKTNAELQALLTMDETTGAASLQTAGNVYGNNLVAFLKYKTNGAPLKATVKATLHASGTFQANGDFPLTSFFIADEKINTFVGGETPVTGAYVISNGASAGLYASTLQDSNLDGPYTVFTAPADGIYDVFVAKRDTSASANASSSYQRLIVLDVAGKTLTFGNSNVSTTMGYQWQNENNNTPVTLTKGQQVPIRILSETGSYAGANGVAFCPRSDAETPVTIQYNASPLEPAGVTIETSVPAAETATVTVDGAELAVTAGAAEAYYPNVRKSDANGNYINKPTLLDALVAADKQEDIGIDAHPLLSSGALVTNSMDTMALSPTTNEAFGLGLTGGAGTAYASIFSGSEVFLLSSGTKVNLTIKVPEDGTYYMIANGGCWGAERYMTAKVDNVSYNDGTDDKFVFGGLGVNAHYDVQSANGLELTAGYHTLNVGIGGGAVRLSHVALVKAASQEEAAAIQASITTKADFNAYFNKTDRVGFNGSTIDGVNVAVNGETITEDWDRYILSDGDEILLGVFDPISVGGKVYAYTSNITWDTNRQLTDETFNNSNFAVILSSYGNMPADVNVKDSMRGMHLTGYVILSSDDAATSGDDTKVANFINYEIQGNAISEGRLVLAIKQKDANFSNTTFDGAVYKNLAGSFVNNAKYDASQLYITDARFGDTTIKAEYADGNVVISSKKAQPIFVVVKNADGSKASAANYALTINPVEVAVEAGQTVYVWGGTPYMTSGTTALPLCAPITVPVTE